MTHTAVPVALVLLLTGAAAAYEPTLDPRAIDEAIAAGQSRADAARNRFHQAYRVHVGRPPVDDIELVTPFRRVVLDAEARARTGDRLYRQRDALAVAAGFGNRMQVFVELTFHPLNTYVGVPSYAVSLARPGTAVRLNASDLQRIPRVERRVAGLPPLPYPVPPAIAAGGPLVGGTVIATFDGGRLDPRGAYDVIIEETGTELARVGVNLGAIR
ncbi:MAG: hypothetical protein HY824_14635 [Acidobacteria bacterium]|nr:hypothetical protein [Acidobacteriota bacterium]